MLALPKGEQLNLHLNNPPSFRNPKSVIVVGLPAVEAAQFPPLRNPGVDQVFCLQNPSLVLPVEGAPLVFSTDLGHDFVLIVPTKKGETVELPAGHRLPVQVVWVVGSHIGARFMAALQDGHPAMQAFEDAAREYDRLSPPEAAA